MNKTKAQLKDDFSNGSMPTGSNFADLIDSLVHHDELCSSALKSAMQSKTTDTNAPHSLKYGGGIFNLQFDEQGNLLISKSGAVLATLTANQQQWVIAATAQRPSPLAVEGWLRAAGRLGSYNPADRCAQTMPPCDDLATLRVDANGKWHPIITDLHGCHAFEIVAHASGLRASRRHAMLHAIVLTSFNGSQQSIQQTHAYKGWDQRRNLCLKWRRRRSGWFRRVTGYDLCIRTGRNYGIDDAGRQASIRYHITRLW